MERPSASLLRRKWDPCRFPWPDPSRPIAFLNCINGKEEISGENSRMNRAEASLVRDNWDACFLFPIFRACFLYRFFRPVSEHLRFGKPLRTPAFCKAGGACFLETIRPPPFYKLGHSLSKHLLRRLLFPFTSPPYRCIFKILLEPSVVTPLSVAVTTTYLILFLNAPIGLLWSENLPNLVSQYTNRITLVCFRISTRGSEL